MIGAGRRTRTPRCSPRPTSSRWAWRSRPQRATGPSNGPRGPAGCSSRTTTTANSATTASRSGPCRRSPRSMSSTPGRPARASHPALRLGWLVVPAAPRGRDRRGQGPHRPALQQLGPAHPGRVHRLGSLRPAGPPRPAGLPAPPGPSRRGGAAPRRRRRVSPGSPPGCTRYWNCRAGADEDEIIARAAARHDLALDGTPPATGRSRTAQRPGGRWSSGTPPRPSTPSPAPSPG